MAEQRRWTLRAVVIGMQESGGKIYGATPEARGPIRVVAENETHLELQCDICGYETSCRIEHEPSGAVAW